MNEVGVVISRYYESLKWLEELTSNIDVYVYDRIGDTPGMGVPGAVSWAKPKDPNDQLGGLDIEKCRENGINLQIIQIPDDAGYEASTYAYHMYSKYNELNDYTVFLQGHPEEYVKNVITILNNPDTIKYTKFNKATVYPECIPAEPVISDTVIDVEPFADTLVTLCSERDYQWSLYKSDYSKIPWLEFCKNMPESTIDEAGNWNPPYDWWFGAGNQLTASKVAIHRHEAEYYKRLQKFINEYMDPNGDSRPAWQQLNQGPNIMEGIWRFVF